MNQPSQTVTVQPAEKNSFGVTSLVCGIISAVIGLGPVIGAIFAFPLSAVGLTFGLVNLGRLHRHAATNKVMTWFGIGLCVLGATFGVIGIVMFNHAISQL